MASSGSRTTEPYIPEVPDNPLEIGRAMRAYRDSLDLIRRTQGIPGLLAELTRINAAQQELATRSLASTISSPLTQRLAALDTVVPLRSPRTASPSRSPERGRDREASPSSRQPDRFTPRGQRPGLGPAAAERIALAQLRADARRDEQEA